MKLFALVILGKFIIFLLAHVFARKRKAYIGCLGEKILF